MEYSQQEFISFVSGLTFVAMAIFVLYRWIALEKQVKLNDAYIDELESDMEELWNAVLAIKKELGDDDDLLNTYFSQIKSDDFLIQEKIKRPLKYNEIDLENARSRASIHQQMRPNKNGVK